jgi:hypothetical protein
LLEGAGIEINENQVMIPDGADIFDLVDEEDKKQSATDVFIEDDLTDLDDNHYFEMDDLPQYRSSTGCNAMDAMISTSSVHSAVAAAIPTDVSNSKLPYATAASATTANYQKPIVKVSSALSFN